ncbi:MAG: class II fructose-bisphosphate aldolase [Verrucomicrobiota bacterium]
MFLNPDQTRQLYEHALENQYAILAVNADSSAAMLDCLLAAKECDAPIIIETSLWQLTGFSFGCGDPLLGVDRYLANLQLLAKDLRFKDVPIVYHTDHIKGPDTIQIIQHAVKAGASSISLDSSELSHEENIEHLSQLCSFADENEIGLTLEMESGIDHESTPLPVTNKLISNLERRHSGKLALWAPGTEAKHGFGDFGDLKVDSIREQQELASFVADRPIGIALHGSTGLSSEQLSALGEVGVVKVNWSSESLLIRSHAAREYYQHYGDRLEKTHPEFKATAMDDGLQTYISSIYEMRVVDRIRTLGGDNHGKAFLETLTDSE